MDKKILKKSEIINNAAEVFLKRGLFNTVMDNIAKKCSMTRRTLYRYFATKEDIAYEVTVLLLNDWNKYQKQAFKHLKGTGIEQLESFLMGLIDHMSTKMDVMSYLGEFDFYFKDDSPNAASGESIQKLTSVSYESEDMLHLLITKGIDDQSIKNVDVNLTVATISTVLWSFGQRVAIRGHIIEDEMGIDRLKIIKNQVKLYVMALKSN